ncbi:hypothetical protein [Weissella cibaria]|uniref:hypothetical protein n=1 Tax=Weissella cibaria TaxID=137591 RepID=UPI001897007D|nr:hypothetical protein [Weissella cibaria]
MLNQKQIIIEWEKAGLKQNGFMYQDISEMYELVEHNTTSSDEANKLLILAIRAAANNGGKSALAVENNLRKWINAGATTALEVGEYEKQAQQLQKPRSRYGQPLRNESSIEFFSDEQMSEQDKRLAADDGYDNPEQWKNDKWAEFLELRATRSQRSAETVNSGRTATGQRVLQRF